MYPKQETQVRKAILEGLEDCTSPETGIGYNLLFDRIRDEVGSKATFNKYLSHLAREGYITKMEDPRHKRGVVLYRLAGSESELQKLDLITQLSNLFRRRDLKPIEVNEETKGEFDYETRRNFEIICNAILSSHSTLMKMLPNIEENYGPNPYIKVSEKKGKIHLDFKTD